MDRQTLQVGSLEIIPIYDGSTSIPEPTGIAQMSDEDLAVHRDYIPGNGRYLVQFGAFLVRTADRLVLLDAGLGPACGHDGTYHAGTADHASLTAYAQLYRNFGRDEGYIASRLADLKTSTVTYGQLDNSLRAVGVQPGEITDVVISHLHCDHIGWVSQDGRPYFDNATVWCHEADADYFLGDNAPDETHFRAMYGVAPTKDRMMPALASIRTWDTDRGIAPGIDVRHVPGHTPGSSITVISSNGERAMMMGDVIHCPLEMTAENFSIMADIDPALAKRSKDALLKEVEDGTTHIGSSHFPGLRFGRLLPAGRTRSWTWD